MSKQELIEEVFGKDANLYTDALGVHPTATESEIEQAYLKQWQDTRQMLTPHLDVDEQDVIQKRLEGLLVAYRILSNEQLRAKYDEMLSEINVVAGAGGGLPSSSKSSANGGGTDFSFSSSHSASSSSRRGRRESKNSFSKVGTTLESFDEAEEEEDSNDDDDDDDFHHGSSFDSDGFFFHKPKTLHASNSSFSGGSFSKKRSKGVGNGNTDDSFLDYSHDTATTVFSADFSDQSSSFFDTNAIFEASNSSSGNNAADAYETDGEDSILDSYFDDVDVGLEQDVSALDDSTEFQANNFDFEANSNSMISHTNSQLLTLGIQDSVIEEDDEGSDIYEAEEDDDEAEEQQEEAESESDYGDENQQTDTETSSVEDDRHRGTAISPPSKPPISPEATKKSVHFESKKNKKKDKSTASRARGLLRRYRVNESPCTSEEGEETGTDGETVSSRDYTDDDDYTYNDEDDEATFDDTVVRNARNSSLTELIPCTGGHNFDEMIKAISDEVKGSFDDTLNAVDQVFNAFTLQQEEYSSLSSKIEREKRTLTFSGEFLDLVRKEQARRIKERIRKERKERKRGYV